VRRENGVWLGSGVKLWPRRAAGRASDSGVDAASPAIWIDKATCSAHRMQAKSVLEADNRAIRARLGGRAINRCAVQCSTVSINQSINQSTAAAAAEAGRRSRRDRRRGGTTRGSRRSASISLGTFVSAWTVSRPKLGVSLGLNLFSSLAAVMDRGP
jgi:hypothetical protein